MTANAKKLGVSCDASEWGYFRGNILFWTPGVRSSLADATLSAVLRTMLAILTILASVARIGPSAGRREKF